jgi:hypothetical protein
MNKGTTPEPRNTYNRSFPEAREFVESYNRDPTRRSEHGEFYTHADSHMATKVPEPINKHIMETRAKAKSGPTRPPAPIEKRLPPTNSGFEEKPIKSVNEEAKIDHHNPTQDLEEPKRLLNRVDPPAVKTAPTSKPTSETRHLPPHPTSFKPSAPRFQNKSQVEKKELVEELMKLILNSRLQDITFGHLLAASGEVRAQLINMLRSHRVEAMHLAEAEGVPLVVSHQVVPLRELRVVVNGSHHIDAVLDFGSSIITIREDLWRELTDVTLNPHDSISMETADTNVSTTKGSVKNLQIQIGSIICYVQAQVVQRSPTKMLLGVPFYALMRCRTETHPDGFTALTVTDPNDPAKVETIATKARGNVELVESSETPVAMVIGVGPVFESEEYVFPFVEDEGKCEEEPPFQGTRHWGTEAGNE